MEDIKNTIKRVLLSFVTPSLPLGAEISDTSIKLVLVRQDSPVQATLLDYAIIPLVPQGSSAAATPSSIIKNLLKEKKIFSATEARFVVSGPQVDSKRISLPAMPKDEMAQAISFQAKDHFLVDTQDSMLDFEQIDEKPGESGSKNIEIIATIAKNSLIDDRLSLFGDTQAPPSVVVPVAYGLFNLCRLGKCHKKEESETPMALIDIGSTTTTIVIIKYGKIRFIRQCGCAGNDFTNALMGTITTQRGRVEITREKAEELKRKIGIPSASAHELPEGLSAQQAISMLSPVIERLAGEIKRSFSFYQSEYNEGAVGSVCITGGTSRIKNIDAVLTEKLSMQVKLMDVPSGLVVKLPQEKVESFAADFPLIAPAIGAAISNPSELNIIPESYKKQRVDSLKRLTISGVMVVVIITLFVSYLFNIGEKMSLNKEMQGKQPQIDKLKDLKSLNIMIQQKNEIIEHTLRQQTPLYYVLKALSIITPPPVYIESIDIKENASKIRIRGIVRETAETGEGTLAKFIKALESSVIFSEVSLISCEDCVRENEAGLEFEINAVLGKE